MGTEELRECAWFWLRSAAIEQANNLDVGESISNAIYYARRLREEDTRK